MEIKTESINDKIKITLSEKIRITEVNKLLSIEYADKLLTLNTSEFQIIDKGDGNICIIGDFRGIL